MFKKSWTGKRKKEQPNKLRQKPTITFRSNLSPETLGYIKKLSTQKEKSKFINQAIEQRYFLMSNKKQFLRQVIQENPALCKYLLRKIGNENHGRKRSQRN